jgi:molybdate transport system regulatory protein
MDANSPPAAPRPERPPDSAARTRLRSKIWLERGGKVVLSDWRVELLAAVDETGSLARAAQKLNVPYKTAWYKLKEIQERSGLQLLETQSGGAAGGGSRLTPQGRALVGRFRRASQGLAQLVEERFRAEFDDLLR